MFFVVVVLFMAFSFFAPSVSALTCPTADYTVVGGVCVPSDTGLSSASVSTILSKFMGWLLGILGVIGIIAFVISGIQYLTSAGDEKMAETAKNNMKYSIIGIMVALSGFIIIKAISALLSGTSTTFEFSPYDIFFA